MFTLDVAPLTIDCTTKGEVKLNLVGYFNSIIGRESE